MRYIIVKNSQYQIVFHLQNNKIEKIDIYYLNYLKRYTYQLWCDVSKYLKKVAGFDETILNNIKKYYLQDNDFIEMISDQIKILYETLYISWHKRVNGKLRREYFQIHGGTVKELKNALLNTPFYKVEDDEETRNLSFVNNSFCECCYHSKHVYVDARGDGYSWSCMQKTFIFEYKTYGRILNHLSPQHLINEEKLEFSSKKVNNHKKYDMGAYHMIHNYKEIGMYICPPKNNEIIFESFLKNYECCCQEHPI